MRADGDADTPHFVAVLLPGARSAFLPVEALGSAIERLLDEGTRRVPALAVPRRAEWGFAGGGVDLPHVHLIDAELVRSLRNRLLHNGDALHLARRPLKQARGRVREDVDGAPAHGHRLVEQGCRLARRTMVAALPARTVVLDDEQVKGGDAAVGAEADPDSPGHVGAGMPDVVFVLAAHAHHNGRLGLLR